ncbi:MAG: YbaB/EbfC family nucleoid-associated protein, partial [Acutalibacteraceae bacterium]|nr:YbaB/EbfC family nucleoid-associated protein [Acutalibacteraceae bacterium]
MKARLPKEYQSRSQADLMRKAQEMQQNMATLQEELEEREYTAKSSGDMVTATVNGKFELTALDISPELIADANDDKEMLEDFVTMAVNAAIKQAQEASD